MPMTSLRVALADDAVLFREGLSRILHEAGFDIVGQVGDGEALVRLARAAPLDVAIIDLRMPPTYSSEGLEAAAVIRSFAPRVGLLVLSQYVEAHHALRPMNDFDQGVGYLLKDRVSDLKAFGPDVRRVAAGDVVIDAELVRRLVSRRREDDPLDALTARERTVLTLMAQGLSNSALSEQLHTSM